MLLGIDVAHRLSVSERYIRKLTKVALEAGKNIFTCKGESFAITKVAGVGRGWVYSYTPIKEAPKRPNRKVKTKASINPNDVPNVIDINKFTLDEKIAMVNFYNTSNYPLGGIVKVLLMLHPSTNIKADSLRTRIKRWVSAFEKNGRKGLEDKRGGKDFKADLELVKEACYGFANHATTSAYSFYCFLYARNHGLEFDTRDPQSDISESAFNRAVKHLLNTNQLLKEYHRIGKDAFRYAEPVLGRKWDYPNQQWEIDATPLDFMVKVPVINGHRTYHSKIATDTYDLVRCALIRVIDNFSGSSVLGLYESANSYADVRLLWKALNTLGKPESIKGDWGKDYDSTHFQAVLVDMGINYIYSKKGDGRGKGKIERSFRTVQHSSEFEALPGFIGHNVTQRKHLEDQAVTTIERRTGVQTNIEANHMWWWEAENWLDNYQAYKEADKRLQHTEQLGDCELLELYRLLGKRQYRTISGQGVRLNNMQYFNFDMWEHIVEGERLEIIEDIDNAYNVFIFKDGQFLCEVPEKEHFREDVTIEKMNSFKRNFRKRRVAPERKAERNAMTNKAEYQEMMKRAFLDESMTVDIKTKVELEEQLQGVEDLDIQEYDQFIDEIAMIG